MASTLELEPEPKVLVPVPHFLEGYPESLTPHYRHSLWRHIAKVLERFFSLLFWGRWWLWCFGMIGVRRLHWESSSWVLLSSKWIASGYRCFHCTLSSSECDFNVWAPVFVWNAVLKMTLLVKGINIYENLDLWQHAKEEENGENFCWIDRCFTCKGDFASTNYLLHHRRFTRALWELAFGNSG